MVVSTRAGSSQRAEDLQREILDTVSQLSKRLEKLQTTVESQAKTIEEIRQRNSESENLLHKLTSETDPVNVQEACGVDPAFIERNRLLGETLRKRKQTAEEKSERRKKQKIGAEIFTVYCLLFCGMMLLSFFDVLPIFEWEKKPKEWFFETMDLLADHIHVPFLICLVYLISIFTIQDWMRAKTAFDLRKPLALWSFTIGLFSIFGSLRTVPVAIKLLYSKGFQYLVCADTRYDWVVNHPAGLWTYFFIISKVPELIDTLFIVLRKKKLITLHWYHHVTVLCYCWHSWTTSCSNGIVYSSMNLTVHAFMYIFYALAALGYRPTVYAQYITIIQILQMLVGTVVTFYANFHLWVLAPDKDYKLWSLEWNVARDVMPDTSPQCKVNQTNAIAGLLMYSSYLYLFCVFFYFAYISPRPRVPNSMQQKKEQ
mmetsp:Transcript_2085/g.2382  ORF Transcript_2085/g.2382 Transcript_2085/m.2382 type:complete len:428 (-) Transcript_2085:1371-2654(-)